MRYAVHAAWLRKRKVGGITALQFRGVTITMLVASSSTRQGCMQVQGVPPLNLLEGVSRGRQLSFLPLTQALGASRAAGRADRHAACNAAFKR